MPADLADELFDKLTDYYADDDGVTVIVDRRRGERRVRGARGSGEHVRTIRDRRQRSVAERAVQVPPTAEL